MPPLVADVPRLLDVNDVARALRVSPFSVRRWEALGKLRGIRLSRRLLFHPDDVSSFVERARQASSQRPRGKTGNASPRVCKPAGSVTGQAGRIPYEKGAS